jgi:hypothetical protein
MDRSRWSGGRCALPSATVLDPMVIVPALARSMPARQRSSVVLPEPDGPSRTRKVPGGTVKDTSRSA